MSNEQIPTWLDYIGVWSSFGTGVIVGALVSITLSRRRVCRTREFRHTTTTPHEGVGCFGDVVHGYSRHPREQQPPQVPIQRKEIRKPTTPDHRTAKWVKEKFRKQFGAWASIRYYENYGPDKDMRALYAHRRKRSRRWDAGWDMTHIYAMSLPFAEFWKDVASRAERAGRW